MNNDLWIELDLHIATWENYFETQEVIDKAEVLAFIDSLGEILNKDSQAFILEAKED